MRNVLSAALGAVLALSACAQERPKPVVEESKQPFDSQPEVEVQIVEVDGKLVDMAKIQQIRFVGNKLGLYTMFFENGNLVDGDVCLSSQDQDLGCATIKTLMNVQDPTSRVLTLGMQARFVETYDRVAKPLLKKLHEELEKSEKMQPDVPMQMPVDVTGITNTT